MSDTLQLLTLEHKNFSELLSLIEQQIRNTQAGLPLDLELLENVAEYFGDYPDECHHPVEDVVFRRLCTRDPSAVRDPDTLEKEHQQIGKLTELFAKTVSAAAESGVGETNKLSEVMQGFVDNYRTHMSMEEEHFFPAAAEALSQEDWEEIDFTIFDREDPLYDGSVEGRFKKLRDKIAESASKTNSQVNRLKEIKRVAQLKTISDFNESSSNRRYSLVRRPKGGYSLESDGESIMEVPACNETQAVWCAFYFLQGQAHGTRRK